MKRAITVAMLAMSLTFGATGAHATGPNPHGGAAVRMTQPGSDLTPWQVFLVVASFSLIALHD